MIELRNVSFAYNGKAILENVSLQVNKGDFAVLVGNTGTGKTTVIQLLTGELLPSSGEVLVGSTRVDRLSKSKLASYRRSIGIISEQIGLLEEKNVAENVALPLEITGKDGKDTIKENVAASLETVNLETKGTSSPKELSLGEYQRAAIARALITEPLVLIGDCPTQRLDRQSAVEVMFILAEQNVRGMTILLTMPELSDPSLFPQKTMFYRFDNGSVHRFLPETQE